MNLAMKLKLILLKTIPIAILGFGGFCMPLVAGESAHHTFAIGTNDFLLDGQRFQIRCGEVHAARVPAEYWRKMKEPYSIAIAAAVFNTYFIKKK